jgi:molybdate transport system regulatory protein
VSLLLSRRVPRSPDSTLKIRVRVTRGDADAFGPGKAQLLESLLETGSLNRSARDLKMSYVKALALVRAMNTHFSEPLVTLSRGGRQGGGTQVSKLGTQVLAEYSALHKSCEKAAQSRWRRLQKLLKDSKVS